MKEQIRSLDYDQMLDAVGDLGEKGFRAKQLFEWVHGKQAVSFEEMTNLSKSFREQLTKAYVLDPLKIIKKQVSTDGSTAKFLFELQDGETVESVWMHYRHGDSICVSSQVGCRMGCSFCASTIGGLVRNLTPGEMLSQIYDIEREMYSDASGSTEASDTDKCDGRIGSIIVMGMGEPFDNYDNVVSFIRLLTDERGRNLSARGVTVSTCGLPEGIRKLADEDLPITLALSLHAPNDDIRRRIMPVAKAYSMEEVFGACREYFSKTGRRITFEYSMISGINDSEEAAGELAKRCEGLRKAGCMIHVNLIPLNEVSETGYHRTDKNRIEQFRSILEKHGVNATIRREMGSGIDAACGQLRHKNA